MRGRSALLKLMQSCTVVIDGFFWFVLGTECKTDIRGPAHISANRWVVEPASVWTKHQAAVYIYSYPNALSAV